MRHRRAPRKATLSEAAIQQHCCDLLRNYGRPDIVWWACPNGEWRSWSTGARLKKQGVRAGASDLMFVINGKFIGLELKTSTGKMSANQIKFKLDLQQAGGRYCLANGLEAAVAALIDIGAFRSNIHINMNTLLPTAAPQFTSEGRV